MTLTDFTEEIYDDLVSNWDGVTFPATIRYYDPTLGKNFDKVILLEVARGDTSVRNIGESHQVKEYTAIVHVHLEIVKIDNTFAQNLEYLHDVFAEFVSWFEARTYIDSEVMDAIPFPNKKRHRLDIWIERREIQ